ncbi:hypothetical protein [Ruegeria lacuscaerulensis]|uniref:hypothetical protein n=1 Tax=Ruegeria lacuscaerulensis TaxID=55218 RepID=UPI0014806883|nr:hypothetical protein [Ruegeria lacuscaerulensis]
MKQNAEYASNKLLRGISTGHVETVRDAWRALLSDQDAAIPEILGKLASSAWQDNPPGPLPKYFGILLALLSELNADTYRQEITRLRNSKLHPVHRRTLNLLAKRLEDTPATIIDGAIPVFIADDVADPARIVRNLERWSKTKGLSLEDVTRIDVISARPELDYLGKYNLFFSGIILTAPTAPLKGVRLWWQNLNGEFTFYHEVGHHVHKHREGGVVAEQEAEANDYARAVMRSSRPILTGVGRGLAWLFKPLVNRLIAKARRDGIRIT